MSVLIVQPRMQVYGGAERLIVKLANYLTDHGILNGLLTTVLAPEIERDLPGTRIHVPPPPFLQSESKARRALVLLWELNRGYRQLRSEYDVINVHNYPAELCVLPHRRPVVWMCNEPPEIETKYHRQPRYSLSRLLIRGILALDRLIVRTHVNIAVVADEYNRRRFTNIYGLSPRIVTYGIEHDFFAAPASEPKNRLLDRFTVLHVGMLTSFKNQMASIETVAALREKIPGIRLILAGSGEDAYVDRLKSAITAKRLTPFVELTGHVDRHRLKDLYHQSDVLLHPIGPQGGWLSPFEAISAGLPIIVSPEMTAADLIEREDLGIVTANYAAAVHRIYRDRREPADVSERRAIWVRDNLSWDRFGDKMLEVFTRAANG